ncbi:response regulator [Streptomyces goshikiensis]|uniref:response regulator n=1 Tax=Kitasatospora sp. MMS16-BH015 TaxID=2018025 RepID=UPI000CA0CB31|nr:response regulator [Kitasatospora sp. MMS16-BH015]AUG78881.1 hypothetical protein CFP65_4124 [Kitasatospora sp. MMS16-BH015]
MSETTPNSKGPAPVQSTPAKAEPALIPADQIEPEGTVDGSMARVLCIEDDQATSRAIQTAFAAEAVTVEVAESGEAGLAAAKLYDYDIIILDLMLPDISGFEVLLRLRGANPKAPVVVLRSSAEDLKLKGFGLGADDYLTKPFNRDELIWRVKQVLSAVSGSTTPNSKGPAPIQSTPGTTEPAPIPASEVTPEDVGTLSIEYRDGLPVIVVSGGRVLPAQLPVVDSDGLAIATYGSVTTPEGAAGSAQYQLVDLFGEGVPGVLYQSER